MPPFPRALVQATPSDDDAEFSDWMDDELDASDDDDLLFMGSTPATNNSSRAPSLEPNPGNAVAGPAHVPQRRGRHFFDVPENFRPRAAEPPARIPNAPPIPRGGPADEPAPVMRRALPFLGPRADENTPGASAHNPISLDSSDEEDAPEQPGPAAAAGARRVMSPNEFRNHMDGESANNSLGSQS
jgi:hypothetical protein